MAAHMIRGFHLLLAGLFAGMGVGVSIASGAVFQAVAAGGVGGVAPGGSPTQPFQSGDVAGLLLLARVFHFIDPLRGALALALIASSAALMLRSTRRFAAVRLGLVLLLAALQGYHSLSLRPALEGTRDALVQGQAVTTASATADSNAPAPLSAALAFQRRAFALLALQSLLASCLLIAEPFAQVRTARDIAREWTRHGRE